MVETTGQRRPARPRTAAPTSSDVEELQRLVMSLMHAVDQRSEQIAPLKKLYGERTEAINVMLILMFISLSVLCLFIKQLLENSYGAIISAWKAS